MREAAGLEQASGGVVGEVAEPTSSSARSARTTSITRKPGKVNNPDVAEGDDGRATLVKYPARRSASRGVREQRLFTRAQAVALSSRHEHCAAEGCDRPFAWCELHHLRPWSNGGRTDLDNAVPLCGFHHRRIHDDHYTTARAPDGSIRFTHRWPSRQRRRHVLIA